MKTAIGMLLLLVAPPSHAHELTLNQELIVACYELEVGQVVKCLRKGADVNARFGESDHAIAHFTDPWTGGFPFAIASWTPLLALANSLEYPDPPVESGELWRDPVQCALIQKQIPREQIKKRYKDAMVILYILLSHKCNLEDHDSYGVTALFDAADNEKVSMARTLLNLGANPNVRLREPFDGPGNLSPLHVACRSRKLVQLLLDHGADADVQDSEGRKPADWIAGGVDSKFDLIETSTGWHIHPRADAPGNLATPNPFAPGATIDLPSAKPSSGCIDWVPVGGVQELRDTSEERAHGNLGSNDTPARE